MKYYLAREGVAFGPYSEFQVRESVRLGIFQNNDLALAEDGKVWLDVSQLFPGSGASGEQSLETSSPALAEENHGPEHGKTAEAKLREKSSVTPLSEYHLREHETYFADRPVASFGTELTRGKIALAAIPVLGVMFGLLILAAVFRHHEPARRMDATPQYSQGRPAVQTLTSTTPLLRPVSLPVKDATPVRVDAVGTPEKPKASVSDSPAAATAMPSPAPAEPSAATERPTRKIEGQMFLSATNGLSYAPPSVDVRLYPLTLLKPYLEKRSSEASARFEDLKSQIAAAEINKEKLRKASDAAFDAYVQAEAGSPQKSVLEQASMEAKKAREAAANTYYRLMQDREDALSGAFYLAALPQTADLTRTDSEGRFSFEVPAEGEFALVAGVQKTNEDAARRYYWFVPVNIGEEPKKEVLLTNNNLSSQGSADSLVQTVD